MKKRLIGIMLIALMVLNFAIANGTKESASPSTGQVVEEVSAGTKEIVVWTVWTGNGGACLDSIAKAFNESQNKYVVNMNYSGSYAETLAKYQATDKGSRPDVVMVSTEYVAFFIDNPGYFVPIQNYIDKENYDVSVILSNLRTSYSDSEGNMLCAPLGNTVAGFFYNEDLLAKAGINPLTDLNSYEEIGTACNILQDKGICETPLQLAANSIYYTFPITAEGLSLVDNNNGKDAVCTKSLISEEPLKSVTEKFFTFIKERRDRGQLSSMDLSAKDQRQAFVDGKVAILMSTCSGLNALGSLSNWKLNFGFHASPTVSKGAANHGQCTGGGALFIADNGIPAKEQGAWEFIKYLMLPENTSAFAMSTGYLPTTISGFNNPEYQTFVNEYFPTAVYAKEAQENTEENCYNAFLPMFGDVHQIVIDYIKKIIDDKSYTPEQATLDLADAVNESIELYTLSK